jgi:vacuolar-type H+-ATPase subunit F/Vma7
MELTVRVLCRPQLLPGFQLAGVDARPAERSEAASALKRLVDEPQVGLVLVDDVLYRALPQELLARLERKPLPIIDPFPAPRWGTEELAEEYVLEILRQAIGYRVRPR